MQTGTSDPATNVDKEKVLRFVSVSTIVLAQPENIDTRRIVSK